MTSTAPTATMTTTTPREKGERKAKRAFQLALLSISIFLSSIVGQVKGVGYSFSNQQKERTTAALNG